MLKINNTCLIVALMDDMLHFVVAVSSLELGNLLPEFTVIWFIVAHVEYVCKLVFRAIVKDQTIHIWDTRLRKYPQLHSSFPL